MARSPLTAICHSSALEALAAQNPERLAYGMVFADADVDPRDIDRVREFIA